MCLFVCVCVCLCLSRCLSGRFNYEGLVPHKNILQVHCWGCLVVQVMFHTLMTSLMTSQGHKVGQILNWYISINISGYSVDQKLKMSEILMAIFLVYSTSGITSVKKVSNIKRRFNLTSDMKISSQIMPKNHFHDDAVIDDVTGRPQSRPSILLYKWNYNIFHDY